MAMGDFNDDSHFQRAVREVLDSLVDQLDELDVGSFELGSTPGSLIVEYDDGSVLMLSQQTPMHELWLSSSFTAWHFLRSTGSWIERDSGASMVEVLSSQLSEKLGESVELEL
jgi:CyaY protein